MDNDLEDLWLALTVGNSRLHWAAFADQVWLGAWDSAHLTEPQARQLIETGFSRLAWSSILPTLALLPFAQDPPNPPALWIASVVSHQARLWTDYARAHWVERGHIPLRHLYATMGLDRALALLGAGTIYGWPVLVIDGGTALTLTTGVDGGFQGGAILPGLGLQLRSLQTQTDALPPVQLPSELPPRWATTTEDAILSGVLYTQLAGLQAFILDWWATHPSALVVLTGGDGPLLQRFLQQQRPDWAEWLRLDTHLMHWGMKAYRQSRRALEG